MPARIPLNDSADYRPPPSLYTDSPHSARIYDYLLGGKTNYHPDRQAAQRLLTVHPGARAFARENRRCLARFVRCMARHGISQFLDIGTGIPTSSRDYPNTVELARRYAPRSHVVHVDNDPVVLAHSRALLKGLAPDHAVAYIRGDLRRPQEILDHPELGSTLDLSRPVGLLLVAVLHFVPDGEGAQVAVHRLVGALPPGSMVAVTHATRDFPSVGLDAAEKVYQQARIPVQLRSREEIARFLPGEPVDPGLVPMARWRRGRGEGPEPDPAETAGYAGLALVP